MVEVFAGKVFFRGEEHLSAVFAHANVVDGDVFMRYRVIGHFDGAFIVDAHVEVQRIVDRTGADSEALTAFSGTAASCSGRNKNVRAVGGDGRKTEELFFAAGNDDPVTADVTHTGSVGEYRVLWDRFTVLSQLRDERDLASYQIVVVGGSRSMGQALAPPVLLRRSRRCGMKRSSA